MQIQLAIRSTPKANAVNPSRIDQRLVAHLPKSRKRLFVPTFFSPRMEVVKKTSFVKFAALTLLSRPVHERAIYRMIRQLKATTLVELGIQRGIGSRRMIEAALRFSPADDIRYTGIDLFEARSDQTPGLKLKDAHRTLKQYGVHVHLVPGDPFSALARAANTLTGTDLVVIRGDQDPEALQRAWLYVPRMLHARSVVLREVTATAKPYFEPVSQASIEQLAGTRAALGRAA